MVRSVHTNQTNWTLVSLWPRIPDVKAPKETRDAPQGLSPVFVLSQDNRLLVLLRIQRTDIRVVSIFISNKKANERISFKKTKYADLRPCTRCVLHTFVHTVLYTEFSIWICVHICASDIARSSQLSPN